MKNRWIILVLFTLLFAVFISLALADGTETLGPPSIDIATGNGMVAAGTGMVTQPGTIEVSIPDGVTIKQVLLYWEGRMKEEGNPPKYNTPGDDTIVVNGTEVTGKLIGGPTQFCDGCSSSSFRADITDLELVTPGDNTLTVSGLEFTFINNGAGVLVLYKDSGLDAEIELFDGVDVAFYRWPEPRKSTEPRTFTFKASNQERKAQLSMFVASVIGENGGLERPNSIEVTTGGITKVYSDLLGNSDGYEWDTLNSDSFPGGITIPAGADSLTVQVISRDDPPTDPALTPASLVWITAGLMVPSPDEPPPPGVEVSKICTSDVFVGDEIEYEITVRNTGDENLTDLVLNDSLLGPLPIQDSLAIGASRTVTESLIAAEAGVIINTVTVTATGEIDTGQVTDTDSCRTNVYELEVTKDAQTSLVKRYNWEINKTVNDQKEINLTLLPTQVVSPTYGVEVKLGSPPTLDGDWVVSGSITISNPAPIAAPLSSVTDVISVFSYYLPVISSSMDAPNAIQAQHNNSAPPGISVPVECPSLIVPAEETLVCTYGPVHLNSDLALTNTAFAELKNRVGGDFSGTTVFSGTAQIDFTNAVVRDLIDDEVTVTDSQKGILGTVNVDNEPAFFAYLQSMPSFSIEECNTSKKVENTASFTTNSTGTRGQSEAKVNLFCFDSASTGFEDLPLTGGNDWDYNDAFFEVSFDPEFSPSNDLEKITFQFTQTVNYSVNTHKFYIQPNVFKCAEIEDKAKYSITRSDEAHGVEEEGGKYTNGQALTIFDDTKLDKTGGACSLPVGSVPPPTNTATLVIEFSVPSPGACLLDLSEYDPIGTFNGEGLFYVPSLEVKNPCNGPINRPEEWQKTWYTIKSSRDDPDPRIVGVPDTWSWPKENQCIWKVYPDITPADPDKGPPDFKPLWWRNYIGPNEQRCPPYDK